MKTKHTQGKWEYQGTVQYILGSHHWVGDVTPVSEKYIGNVCSIQSCDHIQGITIEEAEANAKLIASAPTMLEYLEDLMFEYNQNGIDKTSDKFNRLNNLLNKAR